MFDWEIFSIRDVSGFPWGKIFGVCIALITIIAIISSVEGFAGYPTKKKSTPPPNTE